MSIPRTRFVKGDWNADCDECGQTFKASHLKERWDGAMVCPEDYEPRHPQDSLRPRAERGPLPWTRPAPAIEATTFTDPATNEEVTTVPTATHATFGPADPDSL